MTQHEMNLLQFTTDLMSKTGASPAKVVRRESRSLTVLCFPLHDAQMTLGHVYLEGLRAGWISSFEKPDNLMEEQHA
jgi:hypothetical protein